MIPNWQKCDDHGGFGFKSDCIICKGKVMSDIIEQVTGFLSYHRDGDLLFSEQAQQIDQMYRKHHRERLVEIFSNRAIWGNARAIKVIKQELQSGD